MSSHEFRIALWRAIDAHGNKVARPELDKPAGGFGPGIGYRITEFDGLDGRLNCWKDQIYNFKVNTRLSGESDRSRSARATIHRIILIFRNVAVPAQAIYC